MIKKQLTHSETASIISQLPLVAGKETSREKSIEDEGQCLPKGDQVVE